ncbi:MAG TPA: phosphatase [Epsilonproteobacteria bacterium]|nr:phosphatase [Campylobacterota bacterium]
MIAFDLGSNTLRCVVLDCATKKVLFEESIVVKTADGIATTGSISKDAINRVIEAIKKVQSRYDISQDRVRAVTTQALRSANNAQSVLRSINQATGIDFEIIDGDTEARLTLLAVQERLSQIGNDKGFVLVDIGGGSTEIIFRMQDGFISKSFALGIVTLAQKYPTIKEIEEQIKKDTLGINKFVGKHISTQTGQFVATAGTPTTLAAMKLGLDYSSYDRDIINGTIITTEDIVAQQKRLIEMDEQERIRFVGVGREDLIISGVLILRYVMEVCGFDECIVIDEGLREGVALEGCGS